MSISSNDDDILIVSNEKKELDKRTYQRKCQILHTITYLISLKNKNFILIDYFFLSFLVFLN